jgi:Uma2 family endonuclease
MLPSSLMVHAARVIYDVPRSLPGWELPEETMPESAKHDEVVALLKAILLWWVHGRQNVQVARNLAIRWDPAAPAVGVDPDVCVLSPAPPWKRLADGSSDLPSVRTWLPGHSAPRLAIEVVSETNAGKDYAIAPDKYAASGTEEVWIFDPHLVGPRTQGGPFRLQVWRRREGQFVREQAGDGPFYSSFLEAFAVPTEGGMLRIAARADGTDLWLTGEEAERAAKEAERAAKEAERAAKEAERAAKEAERAAKEAERAAREAAESRVRELEALVAATKSR